MNNTFYRIVNASSSAKEKRHIFVAKIVDDEIKYTKEQHEALSLTDYQKTLLIIKVCQLLQPRCVFSMLETITTSREIKIGTYGNYE